MKILEMVISEMKNLGRQYTKIMHSTYINKIAILEFVKNFNLLFLFRKEISYAIMNSKEFRNNYYKKNKLGKY